MAEVKIMLKMKSFFYPTLQFLSLNFGCAAKQAFHLRQTVKFVAFEK
jgi:hypothetical protein